jgi:hypothetical protein
MGWEDHPAVKNLERTDSALDEMRKTTKRKSAETRTGCLPNTTTEATAARNHSAQDQRICLHNTNKLTRNAIGMWGIWEALGPFLKCLDIGNIQQRKLCRRWTNTRYLGYKHWSFWSGCYLRIWVERTCHTISEHIQTSLFLAFQQQQWFVHMETY